MTLGGPIATTVPEHAQEAGESVDIGSPVACGCALATGQADRRHAPERRFLAIAIVPEYATSSATLHLSLMPARTSLGFSPPAKRIVIAATTQSAGAPEQA